VGDIITATSVLEHEYFLAFPEVIREKMNIQTGDRFYFYRHRKVLILNRRRPKKSRYCSYVDFYAEHGAVLSSGFLQRMRIRPGDTLELTVNNEDEVTIAKKSDVVHLFSPENRRIILTAKLKREFEAPSRFSNHSFREDVYNLLTLTDWSDDVAARLIQIPNLLREVAVTLHDDDVFSAFFEQRTIQLALELLEWQEGN